MNRKSFLKKLGIGIGVAIVAPKVFGGESDNSPLTKKRDIVYHRDPSSNDWIPISCHYATDKEQQKIDIFRSLSPAKAIIST
jgi:hypothetical protein